MGCKNKAAGGGAAEAHGQAGAHCAVLERCMASTPAMLAALTPVYRASAAQRPPLPDAISTATHRRHCLRHLVGCATTPGMPLSCASTAADPAWLHFLPVHTRTTVRLDMPAAAASAAGGCRGGAAAAVGGAARMLEATVWGSSWCAARSSSCCAARRRRSCAATVCSPSPSLSLLSLLLSLLLLLGARARRVEAKCCGSGEEASGCTCEEGTGRGGAGRVSGLGTAECVVGSAAGWLRHDLAGCPRKQAAAPSGRKVHTPTTALHHSCRRVPTCSSRSSVASTSATCWSTRARRELVPEAEAATGVVGRRRVGRAAAAAAAVPP